MRLDVRSLTRYGVALLAVLAALLLRLLLDPWAGNRLPFLSVAIAVVAVAWHGGFGPSLLALFLGIPSAAYLFLTPRYNLHGSLPDHLVHVFGFLFLGMSIGLFSGRLRAARIRAERNAFEADRRRAELELEVERREQLEEELVQRATALHEADRRKNEFLAMLAHELRNPLAPIHHAARAIRLLVPGESTLSKLGEVVERQASHLARLVDDLLDASRVSRGKVMLIKERIDLTCILTRAIGASQPLIEARGHSLDVQLPPRPVWVEGDAVRLVQVFANLLNNAAKYTPDKGHLCLRMEEEARGEVVVRVVDNGIGIPTDLLPSVFELFTQGEHSLARSEGGLGIGLTLVKSLAEMHGGSVTAMSQGPGKGSEFIVHLPGLPPEKELQSPPPVSAPEIPIANITTRRILLVDDNVDAVEVLALVLRDQGHQVSVAHDGPGALEQVDSLHPEVIILDIGLPEMDGYEVASRLKAREDSKNIFLVALTGYGHIEDRRRAIAAGFDLHLVKPVDPNTILALVASPEWPPVSHKENRSFLSPF